MHIDILPRVPCSSEVEHPNKSSEGRRFDSCWENSEFLFPTMSVSLTDKISFSFIKFDSELAEGFSVAK